MLLDTQDQGSLTIVHLTPGRLDAEVALDFRREMVELFNRGRSQILLDLSDIDFLDSSGLGSIVSVLKIMRSDGELHLCGVKETVMSTFRLTRMDRVFKMHASVQDGVTAMSGRE